MRKRWILVGIIILITFLSGCKAEQESRFAEVLPAGQELFRYEGTEEADIIAVDEDGLLYTASYVPLENRGSVLASEYVYHPDIQRFHVYDLEGNCILEQDVGMGNGTMRLMMAEQGKLYCVVSKSVLGHYGYVLYAVDIRTWEVEELCALEGYSDVQGFAHIGEFFYVIGQLEYPEAKSYILRPDVYYYTYAGEAVRRINPYAEEVRQEQIQVDFPIAIFRTAQGTLMIYQYTEEYGFGFLEFSPETQTLTEAGRRPKTMAEWGFTMCEDGFLFEDGRILYFGTLDGGEAELTGEQIMIWAPPTYRKGFVFYINSYAGGLVERICVAGLLKENRTIRLLMHSDTQDKPFGCGYRMEKTVLETEQYALKVLAQDSDFDIFVLSTRNRSAYNLRKNGAFYALNEVEGVQEYLDACFPYIKELATNEDGEIWMLPVQLAIPVLIYNKEYCAQMGVELSEMDFSEFLSFTEREGHGNTEKISPLLIPSVREELFGQYLQKWDSFDTQLLRDYLRQVKEISERSGEGEHSNIPYNSVINKEHADFYYFYEWYQWNYWRLIQAIGSSEHIGAIGMPKLAEGIRNVGTLTFLAVNPQAENLEAALDYISSFAQYMIGQKDSFILSNKAAYTDAPFVHELYEVYANGAVYFAMDASVFESQYYDYISGEITLEEMIEESERRRKIYVGE